MEYKINYGTGTGNLETSGTFEQAMEAADKGAAYTQQDIKINGSDGELLAIRRWIGVKFDPETADDDDIIDFGDFGHYDAWAIF